MEPYQMSNARWDKFLEVHVENEAVGTTADGIRSIYIVVQIQPGMPMLVQREFDTMLIVQSDEQADSFKRYLEHCKNPAYGVDDETIDHPLMLVVFDEKKPDDGSIHWQWYASETTFGYPTTSGYWMRSVTHEEKVAMEVHGEVPEVAST